MNPRKPYPSGVNDEGWVFVAPYLALLPRQSGPRSPDLREVFDALPWLVRTSTPWQLLSHDFPPWAAAYQQKERWFKAGCFEAMAHGLRVLLRLAAGREAVPSAARGPRFTGRWTPWDNLLALHVIPANEQDRAEVAQLCEAVQQTSAHHAIWP